MNNFHILVIEDEPDIAELISYNLTKEGFNISVAADGEAALRLIRRDKFDLLVLDLMLPGIQGIDLCRIIRNDQQTAQIPIIMLTAKTAESDRVAGLDAGADDYLPKPFSIRELIARVRAVLRRSSLLSPDKADICMGDITINRQAFVVTKSGRPVELSATEFRLLLYLAERRGRVFSRNQLLDAVWKGDVFVEPRTVDVHIRRIRIQIEDNPAAPRYIKTRRGIGYVIDKEI